MSAVKHRRKPNNPRQITKKRLAALEDGLHDFGDLSGVIWNERTSNLVGGNKRSTVFDIDECTIELTHEFSPPDSQGTTALGYVIWRGNRYVYRRVNWEQEREDAACIKANINAGLWDADKFANEWDTAKVLDWAGVDAAAWADQKREVAMWGEMLQAQKADAGEGSYDLLPTEDRAPFQQMTFTLHDDQAEQVKAALKVAQGMGKFVDTGNENSNGNALARICELFLGEHGNG